MTLAIGNTDPAAYTGVPVLSALLAARGITSL